MSAHPTELFLQGCDAGAPLELEVARKGQAIPERCIFEHPFALVGRDERSTLFLDDKQVSRRHAYLQIIAGRVFCVDLGSRTGVHWQDGPRPTGWLDPGQSLRMGSFT